MSQAMNSRNFLLSFMSENFSKFPCSQRVLLICLSFYKKGYYLLYQNISKHKLLFVYNI